MEKIMPKKKSYDVSLVKLAIDRYFADICFGDSKKLKMTEISKFLRDNGFPEINDRKLNRDNDIKSYVNNLKELDEMGNLKRIITYSPLNVDEFLKTNNSIERLREALTIRDAFYKDICTYAVSINNELQEHKIDIKAKNGDIISLQNEYEMLVNEIASQKEQIKLLKRTNNKYKKSIRNTLLPEIANEILREEEVIFSGNRKISETGYENMLIDNGVSLKDEIKKIDKLENEFENSLVIELFDSIHQESK